MRMSVVLPAPFGPRRPKTMPSGTSRSTPARAVVDPNRLTTPATLTAGGRPPPDPSVSGCPIAAVRALLVVRTASRDRGQMDVANVRQVRPQLGLLSSTFNSRPAHSQLHD